MRAADRCHGPRSRARRSRLGHDGAHRSGEGKLHAEPPTLDTGLAAINAALTAAGQPNLSNPIDVSARVEEGLERILVESLLPFPVDRISVEDYEAETFHLVLPNPLDYQMDAQGNVTTQPEWDCWISIDANVVLDYTSGPQTLQWELSYAMAVEQQSCNDLIELKQGEQGRLTCQRLGDGSDHGDGSNVHCQHYLLDLSPAGGSGRGQGTV